MKKEDIDVESMGVGHGFHNIKAIGQVLKK